MKSRVFIQVIFLSLLLISCKRYDVNRNTCLPDGWLPLDTVRLSSYLPPDINSIVYISNNGVERTFFKEFNDRIYTNTFCDSVEFDSNRLPEENFSGNALYHTSDGNNNIDISVNIKLRQRCDLYINFCNEAHYLVELPENDKKDQGIGWPANPEEYKDYLTDVIQLKNNGKVMAELVSGKGLIWFIDSKGVKWTLKE